MKTLFEASNWPKLFKMYFNLEISQKFIDCADVQLTPLFESLTGIKVTWPIYIGWSQETEPQYSKAVTSSMRANLYLKYGHNPVKLLWKAKSGRAYDISETDIDCDDIEFWFEGLDPKLCSHLLSPKWSLFTFKDVYIQQFTFLYKLEVSESFVRCMDEKLSPFFEKRTGVKINKHVSIGMGAAKSV